MNIYQLTILVNSNLEEKKRGDLLGGISKSFDKLIKEDLWGNRSLSYDIEHQSKAYYAFYEFEHDPKKISSLDKTIKLNEDIMRYLLLKVDPKKASKPAKKAVKKEAETKEEEIK